MGEAIPSLRKQLTRARENLRLAQERKAQYVLETDVPLQLVREERRLEAEIADLEARLDRLHEIPCPYRGLEPFEAAHAEYYFGRQAMVEQLVGKVGERDFVAVVGPSGCGKSSLVRAGLVKALQEGALPGSDSWAIRIMRPGADPLRALAMPLVALLEPDATEVTRLAEMRKLADHLRGGSLTLTDVAVRLQEVHADPHRLVLIADQFEELYTECQDAELRQAFIDALLSAAEGGIKVVLTLRADFYGLVLADRRLGQAVDAGLANVLPMSEEELRAAVEQPTLKAGREFEPGLVERIVEDVTGEPGNLPLLEFALTELWARQTAEGVLTHQGYEAIGEVEGAIAQRAEAVYAELAARGQGETVRRILSRLTHYGEGAEGTRRRAMLDDLVTPHTPREKVEPVVRRLADARLLVTEWEEVAGETAAAEVAHEALIRGWGRLRRWLDEDRAFGLWRERLGLSRQVWEETEHDEGALLRGAPLAEAEGWLEGQKEDLNEAERAFIEESLTLRQRERRAGERKRNVVVGVAIVVAVVMAILGAISFRSSREAGYQASTATYALGESERRGTVVAEKQATATHALGEVERGGTRVAEQVVIAETAAAAQAEAKATTQAAATRAWRQSQISLAQSLAALAARTNNDDELTTLLTIEALHIDRQVSGSAGWLIDSVLRDALSEPYFNTTLRGHGSGFNSVAFGPDGRWLASGSWDCTVRLWDMADPVAQPTVLRGHERSVTSVAFSRDGRWLASGSDDWTVRLWNLADPAAEPTVLRGHESEINSVAFSPDGRWLASGSRDSTVCLWDMADPVAEPTMPGGHVERPHDRPVEYPGELWVYSVAFSPDGQWLASGSGGDIVSLWNLADLAAEPTVLSGREEWPHGPPPGYSEWPWVNSVAFSPDGRWLASDNFNCTVRLWDLHNPATEPIVLHGHEGWVNSLAFSSDGRWLASGSNDFTVRLWDLDNPASEPTTLRGHESTVNSLAFSPNGCWLASGSADRTVHLWEVADLAAEPTVLHGHEFGVSSVAFSPDEHWLASGSEDGTVRLWDLSDPVAEPAVLRGHEDRVVSVASSPDGRWLASGSYDDTVRLWDMVDLAAEPIVLRGHGGVVNSVAFSPDSHWLASGSADRMVHLCDLSTPAAEPTVLRSHEGAVRAVAFSPDGCWLASGSDLPVGAGPGMVSLWDMCNPAAEPTVLRGHEDGLTSKAFSHELWVNSVAFSPDGHWLASGSADRTVRLWDVTDPTADPTVLCGHEGYIDSVAFSPDGRELASGSADRTVRLWDLSDPAAEPTVLRGHEDRVVSVASSPDGRWLASGSYDDTVRLWDMVDLAAEPIVLRGHEGWVNSIAFSPDGRWLASGSDDKTVRLWIISLEELAKLGCSKVQRNLTREEWDRYLPGQPYRKTCEQWPLEH